jgi:hypothetical protein
LNVVVAWVILVRYCLTCDWQPIYPPAGMQPQTEEDCQEIVDWLVAESGLPWGVIPQFPAIDAGNAKCVREARP